MSNRRRPASEMLVFLAVLLGLAALPLPAPTGTAHAAGSTLYVSPAGSDDNPGTATKPLRTPQKGLDRVRPGGAVVLRGGTYSLTKTLRTRRSGTARAPITVRSAAGEKVVLRGWSLSDGRLFQVDHDRYVLRGLELAHAEKLLWLDGAEHVVITGSRFHDAGGECVRIKRQSRYNLFSRNSVWSCGRVGFDLGRGKKNGEGVYIGTAPEQREKIGGVPDRSYGNVVERSVFRTNAAEAVDIKEDSERNVVRLNTASHSLDPDGAAFGSRGDRNRFVSNVATDGAGAGFRLGGDTVRKGEHGQAATRTYGKWNVLRGNRGSRNAGYGYKFMVSPEDVDCSNRGAGNRRGLYHFGAARFPIPCDDAAQPTVEGEKAR